MATHPEKRMSTMSFKTTSDMVTALVGLSELEGLSPSEYIHNILKDTVDRRRTEVRLLSNALGINED